MTTPNELYAMTPEETTNDVSRLVGCYYNHIPEIDEYAEFYHIETPRIEIKYLKDWCYDGRRVWQLATVWFWNKPVMIIQNAGREGDDHRVRFITDPEQYKLMIEYIIALMEIPEPKLEDVYKPDEDIDGLTEFYGQSLDGYFERY